MKIAVLGAGLMGRAAAWDLARSEGVEEVLLLDADEEQLKEGSKFAGDVQARLCNVSNTKELKSAMSGYDVAVSCVPYRFNVGIAEVCIEVGAGMVDLGGNNDVVDAQFDLSDKAQAAGVTIIPDCGLAPGMASVWAMAGVDELDECDSVEIRCGGLPVNPKPPLNYMQLFSINGLINEYIEPCRILDNGNIIIVDGMSGLETLSFPAPFEEMEAFYTSGGTSTLVKTLKPRINSLNYKTVRYPGHIQYFRVMASLGLTDSNKISVGGREVVPRQVFQELLRRNLPDSGPDVTLLRIDCKGTKAGKPTMIRHQIIDYADEQTGLSSMMRCTALPATAIARMIGDGTISVRGTQPQELVVPPDRLMKDLAKRNIRVDNSVSPIEG